jgi:hypothetical protein
VFLHTKIALSAFVFPFAASAAIANDLETTGREQTASAFTCPWLEGYPDRHPGALHQLDRLGAVPGTGAPTAGQRR